MREAIRYIWTTRTGACTPPTQPVVSGETSHCLCKKAHALRRRAGSASAYLMSEAISRHQTPSDAIRRHQTQSAVISRECLRVL